MKHSESIAKIAPALVKAQSAIKSIHKDATNPFFSSRYTSLDKIMEEIRPVCAANGLAVMQGVTNPETVEGELACINITTMVLHESGEWVSVDVVVPVGTAPIEKGKPERAPNAQTAGSAITYGRRYGISTAFGITSDEDDDGNASSEGRARSTQARSAPPASRPAPRSNGSGAVMPFGKTRGTPLAKLSTDEIESALEWAKSKDKFTEFQQEAKAELASRSAPVGGGDFAPPDEPDDDLPF